MEWNVKVDWLISATVSASLFIDSFLWPLIYVCVLEYIYSSEI